MEVNYPLVKCGMNAYLEQIWYFLSLTDVGLAILAATSFLAASILPFGSEPYFVAFLELHPEKFIIACLIASLGNTLGGLSTWYLGRLGNKIVSSDSKFANYPKTMRFLEKYGAKLLVFSWFPIIGDVMSGMAGWMRLPLIPCLLYMLIGKSLRYMMITFTFLHLI